MSDFLHTIALQSHERVRAARERVPCAELRARLHDAPRPLRLEGFDLIAEVKRASPSEGVLSEAALDAVAWARRYADAGAAMVSVLTEPTRFGGLVEDLRAISASVDIPVMRKDFLVDPYQVYEARAWGASALLLITRILDDGELSVMLDACESTGMSVLLECFDELDIDRSARAIEQRAGVVLGLNCRDLATLREDPKRFEALAGAFPLGVPRIAESGIASPEDAAGVARLGYDGVLVGTALMRSQDPQALARVLIEAGRRARG